jgi:putative CocE/NonD family hydrolase
MSETHRSVRFEQNVLVTVRDGTRLAMDLHVPEGRGPWPVILEYLPYRKDDDAPFSGKHDYFARHRYVGARLDCRGTGASEGVTDDEYRPIEMRDGYDAVEWIAAQEWCDGQVAMTGSSYGGITCVQVAALQPPHLAAIIPMNFTDDRYTDDCHFRGGAWRCYYDVGAYGSSITAMNALPPYAEVSGDDWERIWEEHLEGNEPYFLAWLAQQSDGPYWRAGNMRGRYESITCPTLMIGGWRDGYCNVPMRMAANLDAPHRVLMGPWNHSGPASITPGPAIDYLHEIVRWCDRWMKGAQNGAEGPRLAVYVQGYDPPVADRTSTRGYWRVEEALPIDGTATASYWLGAGGALSGAPPAQRAGDRFDEYAYRPTVGVAGGLWSAGVPFGLPTDQRPDEAFSINYTTEPLDAPMEVIGAPRAVVHVSSTASVMAFVVRLSDVAPDGASALVTNGLLNGTRRDSLTDPAPMVEGEVYELAIDLDATAWRFEPGHRLRLSVSSADFPNSWPTPYEGANRVYRDARYPSRVELPVVPARGASDGKIPSDEISFRAVEDPKGVTRTKDGSVPWEIVHDPLGDRTGLRIRRRSAHRPREYVEVERGAELELWASNREPSRVQATGRHTWSLSRAGGVTTVESTCRVVSTVDTFEVEIDLEVRVDGQRHHYRRWARSFPRLLL